MITLNDFVHTHNMKKKATSNIKIQQVLSSLSLNNVGIFLRGSPFNSDIGIVSLHPSNGTHWVCYINENFFDSYGCAPPNRLFKFIIKINGYCLYSDYKIRARQVKNIVTVRVIVYIKFI